MSQTVDGVTTNYGTATTLQVDDSPVKHFLLKFDVTGVNGQTITNVKLRLYNVDAASKGGDTSTMSVMTPGRRKP